MKQTVSNVVSRSRRAFTLIEVLVATVIMVILVGLVIQITSQVLGVWTRSSGRLSALAQARIAMDLITQDLETARMLNNGLQWIRIEGPVDPGGSYNDQTVSLKLFSPALDRPTEDADGNPIPGDICAIGYRLSFQESYEDGPSEYALYRNVVNAKVTFESVMGDTNGQGQLVAPPWDEASIAVEENFLVSNIVEFKIFAYLDDDSGLPANDQNEDGEIDTASVVAFGGTGGSTTPILFCDILLTVVSDEGADLLQNLSSISEDASQVILEHGQVFTRRVYFPARPL